VPGAQAHHRLAALAPALAATAVRREKENLGGNACLGHCFKIYLAEMKEFSI
jgi:hypothetical protein